MSHHGGLIQLNALTNIACKHNNAVIDSSPQIKPCCLVLPLETQTVHIFEVLLGADITHGLFKRAVVDWLLFRLWEKVRHNTVEELQVILQKLWDVDISNGP